MSRDQGYAVAEPLTADEIAVLQQRLRAEGQRSVPVDGRLGPATITALDALDPEPYPEPRPIHHHPAPRPGPNTSRFPINRLVAALGPFIAIVSGALAAWLGRHFPGLIKPHGETQVMISQTLHFLAGLGAALLLHQNYLKGWQRWESALIDDWADERRHARRGGRDEHREEHRDGRRDGRDERRAERREKHRHLRLRR